MEEFFNKSILNQLYESTYQDFEESVYATTPKIKSIEAEVGKLEENIVAFLKKVIPNEKDFDKARDMFNEYELKYLSETDFWTKEYFKLGLTYRKHLTDLLFKNDENKEDNSTFLNYGLDDFSEWIEEQKDRYTFGTKEYKELQKRYNEVSEKYPNAIRVFEDLDSIELTKDEIKALVELRNIDIAMGNMEKYLCFKLGMKEVVYF